MKQLFSLLLVPFALIAAAQGPLPKPANIQRAFASGSRSDDGNPGKAYWQNRARYNIQVTVAPPGKALRGHEEITYINNSPDALSELALKLFLNIHKPDAPRMSPAEKDYFTAGMSIDAVTVNGQRVPWTNDAKTYTVASLALPQALKSKDSVKLTFDWHFDVSVQSGREGAIDSTSFYLAYFYPRIAVYDDYNGWDKIPFVDALEFYSDFNDYTVSIQVPKNYIVWGTGTLTSAAAVLQPPFLKKYQLSMSSDDVIHVATASDIAAKNITTQTGTNTWQFTATNIPDVAFGISDHYVWDAGSVVVDRSTGRRASVQAAYNDTARDYHHMVDFGKQSLDWLSHSWPGVPYPYEKSTVFQGYADMEYPMMVNDSSFPDTTFSKFVVMHEMAHTYMPFYMGINETVYAFMDEGWATAFEYLFNSDKMGRERADNFFRQFRVQGWMRSLSRGLKDSAIITPLQQTPPAAIGNNEYGKPALGYLALKELLGDELFRKGLQEYMRRWNGKHPLPWDFFNSVSTATGQDLNWFWRAWYFEPNRIDLAVKEVQTTGSATVAIVQNVGGMPAPFDVLVTYNDGTTERFHQTPTVWQKNGKAASVILPTKKTVAALKLDNGIYMDADSTNNEWKKVL